MKVLAYNIIYNTKCQSFDFSGQAGNIAEFNNNQILADNFGTFFGLGNGVVSGPNEMEVDCPMIKTPETLLDNYDTILNYIKEQIRAKTALEVISCSLATNY